MKEEEEGGEMGEEEEGTKQERFQTTQQVQKLVGDFKKKYKKRM